MNSKRRNPSKRFGAVGDFNMNSQTELDKAHDDFARWLRKQKLANTKVEIYARKIRRLTKQQEKKNQAPGSRRMALDD